MVIQGLYFGKNGSCIEKVSQDSGTLSLLAKGGSTEIMMQNIQGEKIFMIEPGDDSDIMEFMYIIEGSLVEYGDDKNIVLSTGDYFYVNGLKSTVHFETLEEVKLLYITNQPIFQYLSNTIKDLMDIVKKFEEKDVYTKDHSSRLQYYCLKIARKLKISKDNLENIALSAYFHDLGKINVPDYILNKPGKLAEEEFEKIKKHPEDGFNMVKATMLRPVAEIIKQHHERLDGSGYPLGLKGKEILIEARIIAVVDSYDAMTSDRSYRKAVTPKDAMDDLWSLSGTKYDEDVVNALEEVLIEEGVLHEK